MSLLDRLQQLGADGVQPQQRGIEKLLKAKSGKAGPSRGPKSSMLGEQAAITATTQAGKEQTFAERLQAAQLGGQETAAQDAISLAEKGLSQEEQMAQDRLRANASETRMGLEAQGEEAKMRREAGEEQSTKAINSKAESALADMASQAGIQKDNLFTQFKFDSAELEDREDASALEQTAFILALQDKKYLDGIKKAGKEQQMELDQKFELETARLILGDNFSAYIMDRNFNIKRDADNRWRQTELAKVDISTAIAMGNQLIKDGATKVMWESVGAATTAWAKYEDKKPPDPPPPDSPPPKG